MMMKKFFFKRFRTFCLIMLVPTILFFCIAITFTSFNSLLNIHQQSRNTLNRLQENFELVVSNSSYQYELLTYNPRLVLSLEKLLSQKNFTYEDVIFLNSMKTILNVGAKSHPDIDSIYFYLDGHNTFFSSKNGIHSIYNYADNEWLEEYKNKLSSEKQWIKKRSFQEFKYVPGKEVISIFQRITNLSGLIIINIASSQFTNTLNNSTSENNELLFLLDTDYNVLSTNSNGMSISESISTYIRDFTETNGSLNNLNQSWITIDNNYYIFQSMHSNQYNISFVSLIPIKRIFQYGKNTFLIFLLVLICNCLITLILAYITTKRNFQQIEYIIQVLEKAEKGIVKTNFAKEKHDEYDVILNNVINIFLKSSQLRQQLAENQYKQEIAELAALQLQINPHFLFNTLQALDFSALKLTQTPTHLNQMIRYLSDILKYSLEDSTTDTALRDELLYLKKYAEIQKMRYGEQFIIYYEVDDALLDCKVFRLMFQPLVENSISHGIRPLNRTGYIKLKVYGRRDLIYFSVIDSGVGLSKEEIQKLYKHIRNEKSKNIGITNLNRRLLLTYGSKSQLRILSKKGMGTCISFCIPRKNLITNDHTL